MINVSKPSLGAAEHKALEAIFESGWIGQGPKVFAFEQRCKEVLQAKHFIALSSCTKSIEVGLIVSGCKAGDEVIIPSLTYASVLHVIVKLGLIPVFVDVEPGDLNISIADIERKITPRTKAVIPMHFRGHSCRIDDIQALAAKHGIHIIEDAAHSFGSTYNGKPVGADSYMACFSFGPLKNICCVEGGGIATNDDEVAKRLIHYRTFGMSRSTWQRFNATARDAQPWHYEVTGPGDKCQLNDVGAAIGLVQLDRLDEIKAKKKKMIETYMQQLPVGRGIDIPLTDAAQDLAYIFCILAAPGKREDLMAYLWDKGITTAIHYYPCHQQPYFKQYSKGSFPVTDDAGNRILTIPSYTDISEADQAYVIDHIKKFVQS